MDTIIPDSPQERENTVLSVSPYQGWDPLAVFLNLISEYLLASESACAGK